MEALWHPGQHPEGRFLPETYAYTRGDSDLDLLGRAHDALDKALDAAWQSRDADLPLASKEEALVLASIVEQEPGIADERPQIAGVVMSRLEPALNTQTHPPQTHAPASAHARNIT